MLLQLLAVLPIASAHFVLDWPTNRGFNDEQSVNFPCGGFDSVSSQRTPFPLSGGPIQLDMGHTRTKIQVLMALGNGEGSYSIELVPTFQQEGPNDFCLGQVTFPSGLNLTEGQNATLQVVTNGDPDGGLYQCADITFTATALTESQFSEHCKNSTGVQASALSNAGNANGTTGGAAASSAVTTTGAATAGSSTPTGASSTGLAAAQATVAKWAFGAVGVLGVVAAL